MDALLKTLRTLEIELHRPDVRRNPQRLNLLLHDAFTEVGRSGTVYSKADILAQLPKENADASIWSQAFSLAEVAPGVALLRYKSAHEDDAGTLTRHTLRSSLWVLSPGGWQLRFHQGTATAPFGRENG